MNSYIDQLITEGARRRRLSSGRLSEGASDGKYEVTVGNIGTVYRGNGTDAKRHFAEYRKQSESGRGRAAGEDVTLWLDGEPINEFVGELGRDEGERYDAERWQGPPSGQFESETPEAKGGDDIEGDKWEVVVGNIGSVYRGNSFSSAKRSFETYCERSKSGGGRAAGEDVTLCRDGEPFKEFDGKKSRQAMGESEETPDDGVEKRTSKGEANVTVTVSGNPGSVKRALAKLSKSPKSAVGRLTDAPEAAKETSKPAAKTTESVPGRQELALALLSLTNPRSGYQFTTGALAERLGPQNHAQAVRLGWIQANTLGDSAPRLARLRDILEVAGPETAADVGDEVVVADGGRTYKAAVASKRPDGTVTLSFGSGGPGTRDFKPNQVRVTKKVTPTPTSVAPVTPTRTPTPFT